MYIHAGGPESSGAQVVCPRPSSLPAFHSLVVSLKHRSVLYVMVTESEGEVVIDGRTKTRADVVVSVDNMLGMSVVVSSFMSLEMLMAVMYS